MGLVFLPRVSGGYVAPGGRSTGKQEHFGHLALGGLRLPSRNNKFNALFASASKLDAVK